MTRTPNLVTPEPDIDDQPFWDHCRNRTLMFQRCPECHTFRHPPRPVCPRCRFIGAEWLPARGEPRIYSYTVVHHAVNLEFKAAVPYVVVVAEFPDCDGVRLISNIINADISEIRIGVPLRLTWGASDAGHPLPIFEIKR